MTRLGIAALLCICFFIFTIGGVYAGTAELDVKIKNVVSHTETDKITWPNATPGEGWKLATCGSILEGYLLL